MMAAYRDSSGGLSAGALALLLLVALVLLAPPTADARTIRTTTSVDGLTEDDRCSLREAVIAANTDGAVFGCPAGTGDDVIVISGAHKLTVPPSASAFDPLTGGLVVSESAGRSLTIAALVGKAAINAAGLGDRVLTAQTPLTLINLTVTGGDATGAAEGPGLGGGVGTFAPGADLTVTRSLITSNSAATGGGIHTIGPLSMTASTVSGNSTDAATGGGAGGINAEGSASLTRTTVAANESTSDDNSAVGGGLIYGGTLGLSGSVIADNSADGADPDCSADGSTATSAGFNVVETNSAGCSLTLVATDAEADPALEGLADNGGPTPTHALGAASAAANRGPAAGVGSCPPQLDQRGAPRGEPATGACDAGAYELAFCGFLPVNEIGTVGADLLTSSRNPASVLGLAGSDTLTGGPGADALCGGAGIDILRGGPGGDLLQGGLGVDIADYSAASGPVTVTLDGLANDGAPGEGDQALVESVLAGPHGDTVIGSAEPNGVDGGAGDDSIRGAAGTDSLIGKEGKDDIRGGDDADELRGGADKDTILGEAGPDRIEGGDGGDGLDGGGSADRVFGGAGADTIKGGDGKDRLEGEGGRDKLIGGGGNDTLIGGPSRDVIKCGKGRDKVIADRKDKVARDCEKVKRRKR